MTIVAYTGTETTAPFEVGAVARAGSFHCANCGFAVALHEGDAVPPCPSCDGGLFERSPLFTPEHPSPPPHGEDLRPDWLTTAREALITDGAYVAFDNEGSVRVVPLQEGWSRVGRSQAAHIRLDDPTVSRRHALIHSENGAAKLLDDRSLNGVYRNGHRIEVSELEDGDSIELGRFTLHFIQLAGDRATLS